MVVEEAPTATWRDGAGGGGEERRSGRRAGRSAVATAQLSWRRWRLVNRVLCGWGGSGGAAGGGTLGGAVGRTVVGAAFRTARPAPTLVGIGRTFGIRSWRVKFGRERDAVKIGRRGNLFRHPRNDGSGERGWGGNLGRGGRRGDSSEDIGELEEGGALS